MFYCRGEADFGKNSLAHPSRIGRGNVLASIDERIAYLLTYSTK
jgi:hypothetical protein